MWGMCAMIPWTFGKYGLMKGCWNWRLINSPFSFRIPCPVYQIRSSTTQRYRADNYRKTTAYSSSIWAWSKDPNLPNGTSLILLHTFFARSKSLSNDGLVRMRAKFLIAEKVLAGQDKWPSENLKDIYFAETGYKYNFFFFFSRWTTKERCEARNKWNTNTRTQH